MSGTCIALVVDDDESIVKMLKVRLEAEGYEAVQECFVKPFDMPRLMTRINEAIST